MKQEPVPVVLRWFFEAKKDQVGTKLGVLDMGCWRKSFIEDEDIFIFWGLITKKILSLQR